MTSCLGTVNLLETIRAEWPVIKQAPVTILLSTLLLVAAATGVIYLAFHENLARKDDLIHTLQDQLKAKKEGLRSTDSPQIAPVTTGPATAIGNSNTAISGNGNSPTSSPQISTPNKK
jgi:hypothetical protein